MFSNDPRSRECRSKSKKSSPGLYWNISQNTNRDVDNKIQHNWPFLVLCKTLSIDSRRDECDQYDRGRLSKGQWDPQGCRWRWEPKMSSGRKLP